MGEKKDTVVDAELVGAEPLPPHESTLRRLHSSGHLMAATIVARHIEEPRQTRWIAYAIETCIDGNKFHDASYHIRHLCEPGRTEELKRMKEKYLSTGNHTAAVFCSTLLGQGLNVDNLLQLIDCATTNSEFDVVDLMAAYLP